MDSTKKYHNPNPESRANPISKLFFCWLMPFLFHGYNHDMKMKDIYNVRKSEKSELLTNKLERNWKEVCREAARKKIRPSLVTAIRRTFLMSYVFAGTIDLLRIIGFTYGMPAALDAFISYFSEVPRDPKKGIHLSAIVLGITILNYMFTHHCSLVKKTVGMRVRIACGSLIYRKALRLNRKSRNEIDVGLVVNLLSNDLSRFDAAGEVFSNLWAMPFVASIGTYIMYDKVGPVAFVGIGSMLLQALPLQGYLSRLLGQYRFKIANRTDKRVKLMNQVISGIQVIKMYAWEKPFEDLVYWLRLKEINMITRTTYIKSMSMALQVFTERLTLYIIIVMYVLLGHKPTGGMVFSLFQLINMLQRIVCILFPMALATYAEAKTSIFRLEEFLLREEREMTQLRLTSEITPNGSVKLSNVHASWIPNLHCLLDISFEISPGSLCCITGSVGSGKSSILNLLLGELPVKSGVMRFGGKLSYASQEPWLFISNIRNNILFGQAYEREKYHDVVKACCLGRDFAMFQFGDKTNVGEKGMSLSGGQRARINLARAVYRDADIYLLDDPLSAVDPHVAKHLMNECIEGYLKQKTRILVTNQKQFIDRADLVLELKDGKIVNFSKPTEMSEETINSLEQNLDTPVEPLVEEISKSADYFKSTDSDEDTDNEDERLLDEPKENQEAIEKGALSSKVYTTYYKAGSSSTFLIFEIFLYIFAQLLCNSCDLWVTFWTNNISLEMKKGIPINPDFNSTKDVSDPFYVGITRTSRDLSNFVDEFIDKIYDPSNLTQYAYVFVYTIFILLAIFFAFLRSAVFLGICMRSSKKLHNLMFTNVLHAKMYFFDTNPSGRILNRFSKDLGTVDEWVPDATLRTLEALCVGAGILMMIFLKSYYMIIPAVFFGILIRWFTKFFFKSVQDVKRLEGTAKAPVFSHVVAALDGLPTIRCANAELIIEKEFDALQDEHTATNFMFLYTFQAFGFYLDLISSIFLLIILVQFLLDSNVLSGDVGLVLSQSLIIVNLVQLVTRGITETQSHMTSAERVLQYSKLDREGPVKSLKNISNDWPEAGRITFNDVYLRYAPDENPILKGLTFEIEPREKIGIVGRTGAGKSSIISALFRLAFIEGSIQIDGFDTENVDLKKLRSKISIIPQEPTLFTGNIRFNLDPFEKADDSDLWDALDAVELKGSISTLDMLVTEGGLNFSAGQRQLICLARAIVRNNRILVMDEATANVDQETDALIQKSISKNFKRCTIITVAHRLNTIIDCDRVIVMDAGEMKEFGVPHELLQNREGYFYKMVEKTGLSTKKKLREIAEVHYKRKNND